MIVITLYLLIIVLWAIIDHKNFGDPIAALLMGLAWPITMLAMFVINQHNKTRE